ncbi:MAG: hypothetical protein WC982_05200 [Advenella sp.]
MATIIHPQKQETETQRYLLVGPHTGKTLTVNGHPFVEGRYSFTGPAHQIASLTNIFRRYSALPEAEAQAFQIEYIKANGTEEERKAVADFEARQSDGDSFLIPQTGGEQTGGEQTDGEQTDGEQTGGEQTDGEQTGGEQAGGERPTLGEAIGMLDPEDSDHWTSNNLPSLDKLSELTGKKVGRADVDAVAEGYTRAKARAAKQG